MATWRYEISLEKYFTHLLRSLEEKFCISAQPCNILSIYHFTPMKCQVSFHTKT